MSDTTPKTVVKKTSSLTSGNSVTPGAANSGNKSAYTTNNIKKASPLNATYDSTPTADAGQKGSGSGGKAGGAV